MYESAAQQDELKQKIQEFLKGYERLEIKYREDASIIPPYLFLTLGPMYGPCPYLHPKYSHQTRIEWLDLLHRYKDTCTSADVISDLSKKYLLQEDIQNQVELCAEYKQCLLSKLNDQVGKIGTWYDIESKISQWLVLTSGGPSKKKETLIAFGEILAMCTTVKVNLLQMYQTIKEIKIGTAAIKKVDNACTDDVDNKWFNDEIVTLLEKAQTERKDITKRTEKEIFQSKKRLFELAESNYICGRVGKINSTFARLEYKTKIDRLLEVCLHHSQDSSNTKERLTPEEVTSIIQFYEENLHLDQFLLFAWNKKKGIFEDLPFEKDNETNNWKMKPVYVADFVPKKTTKFPKTPLFKPYQTIIQHLLLIEVASSTQPVFSQHQIMHQVMSKFPLTQKQEAYEYGMKMLDKLKTARR